MFVEGRKNGTFRFSIGGDGNVKRACLAGDFTDWQLVPMRKQKDGTFTKVVPLPAGTHEYKFVFDGRWSVDRENSAYTINPFGSTNSIARVA